MATNYIARGEPTVVSATTTASTTYFTVGGYASFDITNSAGGNPVTVAVFPTALGTSGNIVYFNASTKELTYGAPSSSSFTLAADSGTSDTFNTGETLTFTGGNAGGFGQVAPMTSKVRITGNGNVGIGTASPIASLDVSGSYHLGKANQLAQTLTDAATVTWDTSLGQIATVTLGGSRTMAAPTNLKVGTYILHVIQGGSGSYTLTWNSVFKWPAGVAPTLTTTVGARDVMSFVSDGTNLYGTYINNVS